MNLKQTLSITLIMILITNLVLLGMGKMNTILFWIVIIVCGIGSYMLKRFK